jgi:hypothetical protein
VLHLLSSSLCDGLQPAASALQVKLLLLLLLLLSLLLSLPQAGARKVYAVEASGMANFARQLAEKNGIGKAVQVMLGQQRQGLGFGLQPWLNPKPCMMGVSCMVAYQGGSCPVARATPCYASAC